MDSFPSKYMDSLTLLPFTCSCNIGEGGIALAEAVHGSAPDIAGKVNILEPCEVQSPTTEHGHGSHC